MSGGRGRDGNKILRERERVMQSYPPRALNRILQEDWTRAAEEGPMVLISLRVDFLSMSFMLYMPHDT